MSEINYAHGDKLYLVTVTTPAVDAEAVITASCPARAVMAFADNMADCGTDRWDVIADSAKCVFIGTAAKATVWEEIHVFNSDFADINRI